MNNVLGGKKITLKTSYMCPYCLQLCTHNFIIRKKYKKNIYIICEKYDSIYSWPFHGMSVAHTNEFEFWYVCFNKQKFYVSFHGKLKLSLPIFMENYKNDRAKCSKRDSIIRLGKISSETRYLDEINFIIVRFQESS